MYDGTGLSVEKTTRGKLSNYFKNKKQREKKNTVAITTSSVAILSRAMYFNRLYAVLIDK
jgi:hypothetical protein